MIEKMDPSAEIYLNRSSGVYHFAFEGEILQNEKSLEDLLTVVARYLRGQKWVLEQRAALVVVGIDTKNNHYVLNNPENWALDRLMDEYDDVDAPVQKRINNRRIARVIVYNMLLTGSDAIILEAETKMPSTPHGYLTLFPATLDLNTQELNALMDEMLKLRMLKMVRYPAIRWLRRQYRK